MGLRADSWMLIIRSNCASMMIKIQCFSFCDDLKALNVINLKRERCDILIFIHEAQKVNYIRESMSKRYC